MRVRAGEAPVAPPCARVVFWGECVCVDTSVYRPGEPTKEQLKATSSHLLLTPLHIGSLQYKLMWSRGTQAQQLEMPGPQRDGLSVPNTSARTMGTADIDPPRASGMTSQTVAQWVPLGWSLSPTDQIA